MDNLDSNETAKQRLETSGDGSICRERSVTHNQLVSQSKAPSALEQKVDDSVRNSQEDYTYEFGKEYLGSLDPSLLLLDRKAKTIRLWDQNDEDPVAVMRASGPRAGRDEIKASSA